MRFRRWSTLASATKMMLKPMRSPREPNGYGCAAEQAEVEPDNEIGEGREIQTACTKARFKWRIHSIWAQDITVLSLRTNGTINRFKGFS